MALIKIADKYYKIPVYVQKLMSRASFAIGYGEPGHTLEIEKATPYASRGCISLLPYCRQIYERRKNYEEIDKNL